MTVLEFLMDVKRIPYWDRTPAISDSELDKLIKLAKPHETSYRQYPILQSKPPQTIPWVMLIPHETWAWINHGQTLEELANRGGLSWAEALAILQDKKWRDAIQSDKEAEPIVKKLVAEFMNEVNTDEMSI